MGGALRGELVHVAHTIARLKRGQLHVRGNRVHSEPWIESVAVVLERIKQGDGTVVGADETDIRKVGEHSGVKHELSLECTQTKLEAGSGRRAGIRMDNRCRESRLCLGGLRCAERIAIGRYADQADCQGRNIEMQRDRCRDGSVIGKVLLPGRLGDELPDRRWIRVARTPANPRRDTDAAVAVGFGQCGRERTLDIGRAAGEVLPLAGQIKIICALLRCGQCAQDRVRILEDRSAWQHGLMHERGQIDRRADDVPTHGSARHQGDSETRGEHDLPLPMQRCGRKRLHRALPASASDSPVFGSSRSCARRNPQVIGPPTRAGRFNTRIITYWRFRRSQSLILHRQTNRHLTVVLFVRAAHAYLTARRHAPASWILFGVPLRRPMAR